MGLTNKQRAFINEYLLDFNATQAAIRAGYAPDYAGTNADKLLKNTKIRTEIQEKLEEMQLSTDEGLKILSEFVHSDIGDFVVPVEDGKAIELDLLDADGNKKSLKLIKKIRTKKKVRYDKDGNVEEEYYTDFELEDRQSALDKILRVQGAYKESEKIIETEDKLISIPADLIAPSFFNIYRDVKYNKHLEYLLYGGRGSTKSSYVSLQFVELIVNHPQIHGLVSRQVGNTLRSSVYDQIRWAINELGLEDKFKTTIAPLEIEYIKTGQKIYFRGGDDPVKIKSIKPPFGYIGILWLEELDQFHGPEAIRSIEQSTIRGGDTAWIFKSFNPPRTKANWANKYTQIPKQNQFQHFSNYKDVPIEWLGKPWLDEAEFLSEVNPLAYEHEYMGIANGTGGLVFENVKIRTITDDEIYNFNQILHGEDFGYYPDPAHYVQCAYNPATLTLYIFGEVRKWKLSNQAMYDEIVKYGYNNQDLLIQDSSEPKSVADYREYGANCRGAEKGPGSVDYSIKWLQGRAKIIIDDKRCPFTAQEFLDYELEQTKDGEFISAYPDKNNHSIDAVRYATNLIWRVRGQ